MIFTQIAGAFLILWSGYSAIRINSMTTRTQILGGLLSPLAMILFVRLIVDFGGWADWFIYVWLLGIAIFAVGVFRAIQAWPGLPWQSDESKARRSEIGTVTVGAVGILAITGIALAPAMLLG